MSQDTLATKVARLERLLLESEELALISDYFSHTLVDDPGFMRLGVAARNPGLRRVITEVLRSCMGNSLLYGLNLVHVADFGLWHGAGAWRPDGVALVLYSERLDLGLVSLARSLSDQVLHFMRFSVCTLAGGGFPVRGPRGQC
jgi:hypothetical protein